MLGTGLRALYNSPLILTAILFGEFPQPVSKALFPLFAAILLQTYYSCCPGVLISLCIWNCKMKRGPKTLLAGNVLCLPNPMAMKRNQKVRGRRDRIHLKIFSPGLWIFQVIPLMYFVNYKPREIWRSLFPRLIFLPRKLILLCSSYFC